MSDFHVLVSDGLATREDIAGVAIRDPAQETLTTEQLMTAMGPVDEILDCDARLHAYFDGPRRPQFGVSPRGSHGEAHGIPRLRTPCVPAFAHTVNETPGSSPRPLLIELGGEIDLRNAQALDDALCEAIDRTCAELLVDLSTVPFIDSSGFRMMVRVHQHAAARNCGVRWLGIQPAPARVAAAAGLDHVLHFEKSRPTSSDEAHAGRGMSTLDNADRAAEQRDVAAAARDKAAERRDAATAAQIARNRISTAADRVASALERKEAARRSSRSFTPTPERVPRQPHGSVVTRRRPRSTRSGTRSCTPNRGTAGHRIRRR